MIKKINWFKVLLYCSLIFLVISLYRANYLSIPQIYSYPYLGASLLFLFLGMIVMTNNWQDVLNKVFKFRVSFADSYVSNGLSVFAKYIPGKVMVIMGRALYISKKCEIELKQTTLASFQTQIITLWVGFIFGLSILFRIEVKPIYWILALLFILAFSLFLFSKKFNRIFSETVFKIVKKRIDFPVLKAKDFLVILPSFILNWFFWSLGFYLFTQALTPLTVSPFAGLSFALAATFAIISIIAPGGLGVREGILVLCLISFGLETTEASTISVASRLWFLGGEIFIFVSSLIIQFFNKDKKIELKN